jgi:hypothetical protein
MKKFAILYNQGIWNYSIVGYDDGTCAIIHPSKINDSKWLSENLDDSIKVRHAKAKHAIADGIAIYDGTGLSRQPNPTLREFKAFRNGNTSYDIKFFADYFTEDRIWLVIADKPDVFLSIYAL